MKPHPKTHLPSSGFTLIEMLIVVAIVGILVAIAVPSLHSAKVNAQQAKRAAAVSNVNTAKTRFMLRHPSPSDIYGTPVQFSQIQEYLLINGSTPGNLSDLEQGTGTTINNLGQHIDASGVGNDLQWEFEVNP